MRIAGIDPGLKTTGYGLIEVADREVKLIEGGVIRPESAELPLEHRLLSLFEGVCEMLHHFQPDVLALEELYSHYDFPETAILMGHARGVLCLAAAQNGIPVFNYPSTQVKLSATGNGRASKQQVQRAIQARFRLKEVPQPDDVADALAVALCHHIVSGGPMWASIRSAGS
ncbi:MAG: crossover junction endodeoxyribonuclease RuvC [Chloroflexota bacterium]